MVRQWVSPPIQRGDMVRQEVILWDREVIIMVRQRGDNYGEKEGDNYVETVGEPPSTKKWHGEKVGDIMRKRMKVDS